MGIGVWKEFGIAFKIDLSAIKWFFQIGKIEKPLA